MDNIDYIENLEKRIHNLEVALLAIVSVSEDYFTPALSEDISRVSKDLFDSSQSLGGYRFNRTGMESATYVDFEEFIKRDNEEE